MSVCLLALALVSVAQAQADDTWKAGVAKAVITPQTKVWLAGYGSKRVPDGKLHDIWMKALALEGPKGKRIVLVTSDFQGVPKEMSDNVFTSLKKKLKLERDQVMITFSHNHCGPRLGLDLVDYYPVEAEQVKLVDQYTTLMEEKMVEMIEKAIKNLSPAIIQTGLGTCTFAVNRRNNKEADVPDLIAKGQLKGPVDHTVPVLTVRDKDKKLVAVLFGYACHPTTLSFTKWCGDYPGFAQLALEKNHPGATAMFVNTCGGDQNPLPRRKVELCEKYGKELADGVEAVLKGEMKDIAPGEIRTAFAYVDLPFDRVMTRKDLESAAKEDNAIKKRWAARMLKKLDDGEKFPSAYPYPLHAWRLGDKGPLMLGTGAETVVDYALHFKAKYGKETWVMGYADDMLAYIPSRRVWDEGGYEGGSFLFEYGRPALRWAGDIEERIADRVEKLVKSFK